MTSRGSFSISASSSSTPTNPLSTSTDTPAHQVDGVLMDYFLIEVVAALRASSAVAMERTRKLEAEINRAGILPPVPAKDATSTSMASARDSTLSLSSVKGSGTPKPGAVPLDEEEEAVRVRLEAIGVHVGANFTERLCRDRSIFSETLDSIKFICKDIWSACWDKQVDNLRTNHRGVYVLQDNSFKPISRLSSWEGRADALKKARIYVALSAGVIKGSLLRLGYNGTVTPELTSLPQCTFQVKLPRGT
jgi:hypothetical protein